MDKKALLEQFEQTKTYDLCKSWKIEFDEKTEIYYSINPAYHNDVVALNAAWSMFQEQQAKVEELQNNINLLNEALDIKEQLNQKLRGREDELQKRVDAALGHLDDVNFPPDYEDAWESFYNAEQALKGEG
ncbi:hypothetical protein [Acinetobacter phage vB_ApiM_IME-Ap7]|uniref:Uncharacterized protein n=1 Tax=Thermovibrio guaymasensis TaxID=240167 RepID=A0A420W5C2_9BACT|nr:hypothetical protein [Thermovibrio guaymasensis]RKQ59876.1 hypothetical protein C7457_1661 [Thermovibrio guaymasensis]